MTLRHFLSVLWQRWLLVAACVAVTLAAAIAYTQLHIPSYQATASVQLATSVGTGGSNVPLGVAEDPLLALDTQPVIVLASKDLGFKSPVDLANEIQPSLSTNGSLLYIAAKDRSGDEAIAIANAFANAYVQYVANQVNAQAAQLQRQLTQLQGQISKLEIQIRAAGNNDAALQVELTALTTEAGSLYEARSNLSLQGPLAAVQQRATSSTRTGISTSKLGAIALVVGLLAGCGVALVREQFDTRLRSRPEVEEFLGFPIVGELPVHREAKRASSHVAVLEQPHSVLAEAVRDLRTSLQALLEDKPCLLIMVTSPGPADGKTFVASNLAAAWALAGKQTIVVSADMRRPRIEAVLGLGPAKKGLAELAALDRSNQSWAVGGAGTSGLPNTEEIGAALRPTNLPKLWALQVGQLPDNPAELLSGVGMAEVVAQLRDLADVVIFDTPPVLSVTDACVLGSQVDGVVVVVAEGSTDRGAMERAVQRLNDTGSRVLGLVMNRSRTSTSSLYYPY